MSNEGLLESSLIGPFQTYSGKDLYSGVAEKAAVLAFGIIRNHPFVDGNKRTAFVLMVTFLRSHRYRMTATDDEAEEMMVSVAAGTCPMDQFIDWVKTKASKA